MDLQYTDQMKQKGISFVVHGDPGVGKTSLIKTLLGWDGKAFTKEPYYKPEEILLCSVDAGEYVLRDSHIPTFLIEENKVSDFREFVKWLHEGKHSFKFVFVDNMTELEKFFLIGLTQIARKGRGSNMPPDIKDWGDSAFWMRKYMRDIRNLTYKGMNVIFIFWSMVYKISDVEGEVTSMVVPMCMAKTTMEFCGLVDFVAYMGIEKEGKRYLQFESDKLYKAKKRDLPDRELKKFEEADLGAIFKRIQW